MQDVAIATNRRCDYILPSEDYLLFNGGLNLEKGRIMFTCVYWKFAVNPRRVNKGESRLGQLIAYSKDYWHVLFNMEKLAKAGEEKGYFQPMPGAKSCLYGISGGFEFRAYVDERYEEEAQLALAAMIGFVEESPNFHTVTYHYTEIEL